MRGRQWSWVDGAFFAFTAVYFYSLLPYGLNLDDEGTLLYQIYRTSLGHRLYSDFHAGYTPGVYWWNGLLFRWFSVNVLVVRFALAVVNSLAVYMIYTLAQRLGATRGAAAVGAWSYVALIPYYDGQFFSANIPYPIWYVSFLWLVGIALVLRWWERGSNWWLFAAGAVAGLIFGFKPNSGLLAAAGCACAVVVLSRVVAQPEEEFHHRLLVRATSVLLAVVPFAAAAGLAIVVSGAGGRREMLVLVFPLILFAAVTSSIPAGLRRAVSWRSAWWFGVCFLVGMALAVAPWGLHYWRELGTVRFLRTTLFVGTGFDKFYFLPYPSFSAFGQAVFVGLAAAVAVLWAMRQRFLPGRWVSRVAILSIVAVAAALWWRPPNMVEGLSASIIMRLRDVSFALALAVLWAGIVSVGFATWRLRHTLRARGTAEDAPRRLVTQVPFVVIVLFSALFMHGQLYPRADFMHLVPAVPALLPIGAWLLSSFTKRFGTVLCRNLRWGRRVRTLTLVGMALVIALATLPAWQRAAYLWRFAGRASDALVRLQSSRAPLVIEPAAARVFLSLNQAVRYLSSETAPGEFVFTFPVLDVVSFLADRHNPTRHGYFFPGWPGHEVEAEVIDALRQRPPRFIVTLHDHPLFFATAPVYYFNLRNFVIENYRFVGQFGLFDILAPQSAGAPPTVLAETLPSDLELWKQELRYRRGYAARALEAAFAETGNGDAESIATAIQEQDPAVQYEAVQLVRKSRSREGTAALALLLEREQLEGNVRELAIRTLAESGDTQSIAPLVRLYEAVPGARAAVAGLLFHISSKLTFSSYWFSQEWGAADEEIGSLEWQTLGHWADNPFEPLAVRLFAVRVAPHLRAKALAPTLVRLVGDRNEWVDLSTQAAGSLAALELARPVFPAIVRLVRLDRLWIPAVVAEQWDRSDPEARAALELEMANPSPQVRATAFWIAAGVRDAALQPSLERGLADPEVEVRMAAAWGLGELGERTAAATLQRHLGDPDDRVRAFVRGALAKLGVLVPG